MKQMIYTPNRNDKGEILATGDYKGFCFYVVSYGTYPCAYVDVSNTSLANKDYYENDIDCHGGLTYGRDYLSAVDTEKANGNGILDGIMITTVIIHRILIQICLVFTENVKNDGQQKKLLQSAKMLSIKL